MISLELKLFFITAGVIQKNVGETPRIGVTFAVIVCMKVLVKVTGSKDNSDLVAVGGSALTIGEFVKLLKKVGTSSFDGTGGTGTTKGLIPQLLESIKGLTVK